MVEEYSDLEKLSIFIGEEIIFTIIEFETNCRKVKNILNIDNNIKYRLDYDMEPVYSGILQSINEYEYRLLVLYINNIVNTFIKAVINGSSSIYMMSNYSSIVINKEVRINLSKFIQNYDEQIDILSYDTINSFSFDFIYFSSNVGIYSKPILENGYELSEYSKKKLDK